MPEVEPVAERPMETKRQALVLPVLILAAIVSAEVLVFGLLGGLGRLPWGMSALLFAIAFGCEFVDSSLGMGYGTTLTPLLMLMGMGALKVVPVVLMSEFVTGLTAGGFHHTVGNADLRRGSRDRAVVTVLALAGVAGAIIAVFLAVRVPAAVLKTYIGLMILGMGILILVQRGRRWSFSMSKIWGLGLLSAFNKGISGGGYGPIVTAGQVLSGCRGKTAVGCTSLAEGLVCLVGVISYLAMKGPPDVGLALPIVVGATISAPVAALTTRALDRRTRFETVIGAVVVILGIGVLLGARG